MPDDIATTTTAPLLRAAQIGRTHGVAGELRVGSLGGGAERFAPGTRFVRESTGETLTVASVRVMGDGGLLLRFLGHDTRESAALLTNSFLSVPREEARKLGEDEWFVVDLIGCDAVDEQGTRLGAISEVESYMAHDVVVVADGDVERRYPMTREFVVSVDLDERRVTLSPWAEED